MVEVAKYLSAGAGGTMISDLKSYFPLLPTRKTVAFAYFFMFSFVLLIAIFAFGPSSNSASTWAPSIFLTARTNSTTPSPSDQSYGSHFSSIFSYFFPNSSQVVLNSTSLPSPTDVSRFPSRTVEPSSSKVNQTVNEAPITSAVLNEGSSSAVNNLTQSNQPHDKAEVLKQNQSISESPNSLLNGTVNSTQGYSPAEKNITGNGDQRISENGVINNFTSSFASKKDNDTSKGLSAKQENGNMLLKNCDIYNGNWVRDDSYPLYEPGSCSLIDEQFNCFLNRRPDDGYYKLKWKPNGCDLPRLNGSHMLELLRGKRVVFVGDSLNRNMWESLVCILRKSVKNQKKVYEASGRHHFRSEASYSFIFEDYKFSVEFFVAPFLVQEWETEDKNGTKKETLRLDLMEGLAEKYKSAEIIIFNTGHWWTHEKTSKGQDYYQEGSHIYAELNVLEAFRKALTTWGRWVDANINSKKSLLLFRGYSVSHFSGGQWNSGGQCDNETEPIMNESYLTPYPDMMTILESVLKGTKTPVSYMNITRLTDFRKDGHPSVYRKQNLPEAERRSPLMFQDCSHWCLPGVPDAWNELLYAELLRKLK